MVLGITGPWGSGKSSIIYMVAEAIENEHKDTIVVQFNPWLINSRDDLITSFFAEVTAALSMAGKRRGHTQLIGKLTGFAKTFFDYGKRLAPAANLLAPVAGSAAAAGFDALIRSVSEGDTVYDLRKKFQRELEESKTEVVVLIDEIDRLNDSEVAVVAQLVRAIADFPHFSYLLAYDAQRVAEALGGGKPERGQAYLEKIVQLSVPLPVVLPGQIKQIIKDRFGELVDFPDDHEQRLKALLDTLIPSVVNTFRDAKRLLGVFDVLYRTLRFEVNELDLLGWAAILTKFPRLEQALRRHRELIIGPEWKFFGEPLLDWTMQDYYSEPVSIPIRSRRDDEEIWLESQPEELLCSGPDAPSLKSLVECLFALPEGAPDTWIGFRLPLTKVLTFGTLIREGQGGTAVHPRYVHVIQEIGKKDSVALAEALRRAEANGNLAEYLIAIQGCGFRAHPNSITQIWPAFSDFAEFVPALTGSLRERPNRLLAKFLLGPYLASLGAFRMFVGRNLDVLRGWIAEGRLGLAGHLLELQIERQEHVHPNKESVSFYPFVEQEDILLLCAELSTACQTALDRGTLLDSIPDLACLRVALDYSGKLWDDENIRQKFDELLCQPAQLDRFVWYCYGDEEPGIAYVRRLVADYKSFLTRVGIRLQGSGSELPRQIGSAYENASSRDSPGDFFWPARESGTGGRTNQPLPA
jgi:hypothetical protein